jgi:hypothetical protein
MGLATSAARNYFGQGEGGGAVGASQGGQADPGVVDTLLSLYQSTTGQQVRQAAGGTHTRQALQLCVCADGQACMCVAGSNPPPSAPPQPPQFGGQEHEYDRLSGLAHSVLGTQVGRDVLKSWVKLWGGL